MARWCVLVLLLAVLRAHAEETTTDIASTEGKTEPATRMPMHSNTTVPPLIHQESNDTTTATNTTTKTPGKNAATGMDGRLAVVAVVGVWLTLSAI